MLVSICGDLSANLFPDVSKVSNKGSPAVSIARSTPEIEALVKTLRSAAPGTDELAKTIANEAEYFERRADALSGFSRIRSFCCFRCH